MKKLICYLASIAIVAGMTACGNSDSSSVESVTSAEQNSSNSEVASSVSDITTTTSQSETTTTTTTKQSTTTTTAVTTTTTKETTTTATANNISSIESSEEYVNMIGKKIEIFDSHSKIGELIGALDGFSFKYGDKSFEIYKYNDDAPQLAEAKTGKFSFTLGDFGEFNMNSVVNGNFIMIFDESDDIVINAFMNV